MFYDRYFRTDDGLRLHLRDYPPKNQVKGRLPIVCLPGLTRNVRDFHKLALFLSHEFKIQNRVLSINYRGRGQSEWDSNKQNYNIIREAQDVLVIMDELAIKKANFIGTSRGGLIIHIIATLKPDILNSIVLNDIGPEIELNGLLEIQNYLEMTPQPTDWQDAADIQKKIHGTYFTDLTPDDWNDMARNIYIEDQQGMIKADFDPAIVDHIKILQHNTQLPTLWDQFNYLKNNPVLTIRGGNSTLFSDYVMAKMHKIHPHLQAITVKNQGHPPILHKDGLAKQIADFFKNQTI